MKRFAGLVCLVSFVCFSSAFEIPRFYGEEVIVTATRLPQLKLASPWNVTVLKSEDFKGKMNLGEALREVAGADLKSSGYLGSVVTARFRGATSQQVLILMDGRRLNSPLLGLIDLNDILLDEVEKVEIVRAPLSALYGSDAIGGVVNLISRKEDRSYNLSYGSLNKQQFALAYKGTSFNFIKTDGFRQNGDYTAQRIGQNLKWGDFEVGLNYYNADKGVPRVPNSEDQPYSASTPGDRQKDQNLFGDVAYARHCGPLESKTRVYFNQLDEQFHSYNFFTSLFEDTSYLARQMGAEVDQVLTLGKRSSLSYGLEARQDEGRSNYIGEHNIRNYAARGQLQLGQQYFNVVAGARLDKHSAFGYTANPRLGVSFFPQEGLTLRASAGNAFKAPTLNDLYWNDPIWQMYGSASLKPETSQSVDLGFEKSWGNGARLSLDYFTNSIRDLILWDWDLSTNITRAKNVGAVEAKGWEAEGGYRLTPALEIFCNYTWQEVLDAQDINPAYIGKKVPYSPQNKYGLGVKVLSNVKITASYMGERFADGSNTLKLPEYTLVSVWAGRKFGRYEMALSIDNLFNQVYYESLGYHPVTYAQLKYPMPGRSITVSLGGQI